MNEYPVVLLSHTSKSAPGCDWFVEGNIKLLKVASGIVTGGGHGYLIHCGACMSIVSGRLYSLAMLNTGGL